MRFSDSSTQYAVPEDSDGMAGLTRTTHLAVGAHHDDIPVMALDGIGRCLDSPNHWFLAVTVTDGGDSPRSGPYADFTREQMIAVRRREEEKAAAVGCYGGAIQLGHTSEQVKDGSRTDIVEGLTQIIAVATPEVVYTHNLADKHDTHVAVALRTIAAIRNLPPSLRPRAVYGCEVWRDLDWMADRDKVIFDVSRYGELSHALLSVYDSQVAGGKRYDRATAGRRAAHATFLNSHEVDSAEALIFAMDLSPLIKNTNADIGDYVTAHLDRTRREISQAIRRMADSSQSPDPGE